MMNATQEAARMTALNIPGVRDAGAVHADTQDGIEGHWVNVYATIPSGYLARHGWRFLGASDFPLAIFVPDSVAP
jgi:hypothetical protein